MIKKRHNEQHDVLDGQYNDCLLGSLFTRTSKKTSILAVLAFVRGIYRWPMDSPYKGPGTRKIFPFADVIMT